MITRHKDALPPHPSSIYNTAPESTTAQQTDSQTDVLQTHQHTDEDIQPSKPKRRTPDYVDLCSVLGQKYVVDPLCPSSLQLQHMSNEGKQLIGRLVLFKWNTRGSKNWQIGKLVSQLSRDDQSPKDNFQAHWSPEEPDAITPLDITLHTSGGQLLANCDFAVWSLVNERPLGDDVNSMAQASSLHDPPSSNVSGRPKEARLKPAFGPMSGKSTKKAKGGSAPVEPAPPSAPPSPAQSEDEDAFDEVAASHVHAAQASAAHRKHLHSVPTSAALCNAKARKAARRLMLFMVMLSLIIFSAAVA